MLTAWGSWRENKRKNNTMVTTTYETRPKGKKRGREEKDSSEITTRPSLREVRTAVSHGRQSLTRKGLRVGLTSDTPCCAAACKAAEEVCRPAGLAGGCARPRGRHTHLQQNFKRPGWPAAQSPQLVEPASDTDPVNGWADIRSSAAKSERLRNTALGIGRGPSSHSCSTSYEGRFLVVVSSP